ncbi:alpha/beta fold hydrolase [Cohnella panacarvi]|uniref:alpha/beta fold hydrolase n=1 Tax=Cohnella panacarvi TaxID=400776 RepID=UPI00047D2A76|nr:alpha/beta hydrolase [Cohnella panacarvi]
MSIVRVNGIRISYATYGEGFPLIAISGKDSNMEWWHPAVKEALSANNRLILLDNRGTGRSEVPPESYGISDMAQDVVGLMDALGISQAHILGQSMGGMIAQEIAIEYPERVAKLILASTTCGVTRVRPSLRMLKWMFRKPSVFSPRDTLNMLYSKTYMREYADKIAEAAERMGSFPPSARTMAVHKEASRKFDSLARLGRIVSPTLIIHGHRDWVFRPPHAVLLARYIPDSKLLMYANAGHGVLSQEHRKVMEEIRRFIG